MNLNDVTFLGELNNTTNKNVLRDEINVVEN